MKFNILKVSLFFLFSSSVVSAALDTVKSVPAKVVDSAGQNRAVIITFDPQKVINGLDEISDEKNIIDNFYKEEFRKIELEMNEINLRKERLNKEIKDKGAALDRKVIEEQYTDIVRAESAIYEKQSAMEINVRQSVMELTAKAKKTIDEAITTYMEGNPEAIVIATEYKENQKYSITNILIESSNNKYLKSRGNKNNDVEKKDEKKIEKPAIKKLQDSSANEKSPVKEVKI